MSEIATGEAAPRSLRRVVSLPWLVLYGLGSTVGAGIYVLIGVVAGRAGALTPLAFLLAAVLAFATALAFAELSARYPSAGGALVYVREGLGSRFLSFAVGVSTACAGMVSAATVSRGFAGYAAAWTSAPSALVIVLVVGLVGTIAAVGVRHSVVATGLVTVVEVGGLALILVLGAYALSDGVVVDDGGRIPSEPGLAVGAIVSSTVLCFFAFLGFEDMVNLAEEVRDVRKTLPRAILATLALSTLLYASVAYVSVRIVPPAELAASPAPLALVYERAGGSGSLLTGVALIAMLNGALVQIVMASRIALGLARVSLLPAWFGRVDSGTRTPLPATAAVTAGVVLLALSFPLEGLAAATASIALGCFVLVNLSLLRILHSERLAGMRRPGSLPRAVPLFGAAVSGAFLVLEIGMRLSWIGSSE